MISPFRTSKIKKWCNIPTTFKIYEQQVVFPHTDIWKLSTSYIMGLILQFYLFLGRRIVTPNFKAKQVYFYQGFKVYFLFMLII
jgi:hypothetical protein